MQFSEKYRVEFSDCDENQNLKLARLVDLMMQVSEHQLEKRDAGTPSLNKRGLGWVVTQYHFEVVALPHPGDRILLTTNASGYNRFFEYRDFGIKTLTGGILVTVKSRWVLFDLKKRHLIPTDQKLMQKFSVPLLTKLPQFPRLRPLPEYAQRRQYRARYDDLDTNHHLTNSHYFNWFEDILSRSFLKKHLVRTIDISFDQEVQYAQVPYSCLTLKREGTKVISYHAIEDKNGKEEAVAQLTWRQM